MIGIDEVGRGCWAGPLVVVAARARISLPLGLRDSKKLSAKQRVRFHKPLLDSCAIGRGWVQPDEIDRIGLSAAMQLAVERALEDINAQAGDEIIMDGSVNYCPGRFTRVRCQPKADDLYPVVSAASIIAKVERDAYMQQQADDYPDYGFERHVGYGTKEHSQALQTHGVTPLHRLSYKPVKVFMSSSA